MAMDHVLIKPVLRLENFNVLGKQRTSADQRMVAAGDDPSEMPSVCIVDVTTLRQIRSLGPRGEPGVAGDVYKWLGIADWQAFPKPVVDFVVKPGDAHCK